MNETAIDGWGEASEVMARLAGSWSFERDIEGQGCMLGLATFTALDAQSVAYREQGRLRLRNGTELEASREYIFRRTDRGFEVFFNENPPRLFHAVSLSASVREELTGSSSHRCNLDHYRSTYTFRPNGSFVIRHVVSGPRKDYTMVTIYHRAAPGAANSRRRLTVP